MQKFKESFSVLDFHQQFPNSDSCLKYLFDKKWQQGYKCRKCEHKRYCLCKKKYNLRCTSCGYEESPTAHTLFHKVKFSLEKAFLIIYYMATLKKGMATLQMHTTVGLPQRTCWKFKLKIMHAMKSSKRYKMSGSVELLIFDMGINHVEKGGEIIQKKKQVVIAREAQGRRNGWIYGQYIQNLSGRELVKVFQDHLDCDAHISINGCHGYKKIKETFHNMETILPLKNKKRRQPKGKRNFKPNKGIMTNTYRRAMGLFYLVRGTYGHAEYVQAYMDEYFFRFNRSDMSPKRIFEHLLDRMIFHSKMSHNDLVTYMTKAGSQFLLAKNLTPT